VKTSVDEFLAEHTDLAVHTIDGYRSVANTIILHPRLGIGGSDVAALTAADLIRWKRSLTRAGKSRHLVRLAWRTLSSALSWDVEGGYIPANPCLGGTPRRTKAAASHDEEDHLALPTWAEVHASAVAIPHVPARLMMLVMAWSGPRFSEAAGIYPVDVLPSGSQVRLQKVWAKGTGKPWSQGPLKGGHARAIPVPAGLMTHLAAYRDTWTPPEKVQRAKVLFPAIVSKEQKRGIGVWTPTLWRTNIWTPMRAVTGLSFRPKDLRAFAASALIDAGGTVLEARDLLGHTQAEVTERHYARARDLKHADPARMAIRLDPTLTYVERLDALYAAWCGRFGDPF
jgi:integrase